MWHLDDQNAGVVLLRRRPLRPVVIAGAIGLFVAALPLVIAPEPGVFRFLSFGVLFASAAALVVLGLPRRERAEIVSGPAGLSWAGEPLPPPACVELAGDDTEEPPLYGAMIVWSDGRRRVALEGDEPARILHEAILLAGRLGMELRPGWGLERHFSETGFSSAWVHAGRGPSDAPNANSPVDAPVWHTQRRAGIITLAAGVFVLAVTFTLIDSPARSVTPGEFSLALPALAIVLVLAIGALLFGLRRRIVFAPTGVMRTTRLFGFRVGRETRIGDPAPLAFGVAPDGGGVRHLLFATANGSFSVTADEDLAKCLSAPALRAQGSSTRLRAREPTLQPAGGSKSPLR